MNLIRLGEKPSAMRITPGGGDAERAEACSIGAAKIAGTGHAAGREETWLKRTGKLRLRGPFGAKTSQTVIGVRVTEKELALAVVANHPSGPRLLKWQTLPLPEGVEAGDPRFTVLLDQFLSVVTPKDEHPPIWCALESASLKMIHLTLPDMTLEKMANAAFWGLKKETDFDETTEVFDFEILDTINVDGGPKKKLIVYAAPKSKITALETAFSRAGYPLKGLTAMPFAMQNFTRTGQFSAASDYFGIVNICRDNSEVFCFSKTGIILFRSLRTGSEALTEHLDFTDETDAVSCLSAMAEGDMDPGSLDRCERLIAKIIRTGDYCAQHYTGNTPLGQYLFFGDTDQCEPFMVEATQRIPAKVEIFEPFQPALAGRPAAPLPKHAGTGNSVLAAFGIALSRNRLTPNFLFTHAHRKTVKKVRQRAGALIGAGLFIMAALVSAHVYLNMAHARHQAALERLETEQAGYGGSVCQKTIDGLISRASETSRARARYVQDYLPLAVLGEICGLTPSHVRLKTLSYQAPDHRKDMESVPDKACRRLKLTGLVSAPPSMLNSELGNYMLTLSKSPVFGNIEISQKRTTPQKQTLVFSAVVEVL